MPNTQSATKAHRQSLKHRSRNVRFFFLYKESVKTLERAIKTSSVMTREDGIRLLSEVYSRVDTLVKKGIIHASNAARKKSNFSKVVKTACLKSSS